MKIRWKTWTQVSAIIVRKAGKAQSSCTWQQLLGQGAAHPCLLISKKGTYLVSTTGTCPLWWHSSMCRKERLLSQEGLKDTSLQETQLMGLEVSSVVLLMGPFSYLFGSCAWKPLFCIRPQLLSVLYNTVYEDSPSSYQSFSCPYDSFSLLIVCQIKTIKTIN